MIGIYKITSPTNKVYIGQSWDIEKRWKQYINLSCKEQPLIYRSLNKHGVEQHNFQIIHELPNDVVQDVLDNYEILYINQYKDCGIELLNLKEGGKGGKHSDETKQKMSESHKGFKHSEETKQKMSNSQSGDNHPMYNKNHSEETKQKMKKSSKPKTEDHIIKIKENASKSKTEETKNKISESHKGKPKSEKHKANLKLAWIKRKENNERKKQNK